MDPRPGAPISPELRAEVEGVRWRQHVGGLVGATIGCAVIIPSVLEFDPSEVGGVTPALAWGFIPYLATWFGRCAPGAVDAVHEVRGSVRVAHPWAPRLRDFVGLPGLVLVRIEVAVIVAYAVVMLWEAPWAGFGFGPDQSGYAWVTLTFVVGCWAAAEVVAHRVVARPQPSCDATTLFWRDAIRADRVRDVYLTPASLGPLTMIMISTSLPHLYGTPNASLVSNVSFAFGLIIPLLVVATQIVLSYPPKGRRYRSSRQAARRAYEAA